MSAADSVVLHHGDSAKVLASLNADSIDAVVTDPPYGLSNISTPKVVTALTKWVGDDRGYVPGGAGFMNAKWDSFVPPPALWDEVFRVLKPGAHMFVFSGARTVNLMGTSIQLAGFELRDTIAWIRADGMPKGQEVSRMMTRKGTSPDVVAQWEDWHSVLKPSMEPIIVARKPLDGTLVDNVLTHGTGALNVRECRVPVDAIPLREIHSNGKGSKAVRESSLGRFPSNVILDEQAAAAVDEQAGIRTSGKPPEAGFYRNARDKPGVFGGGKGMFTEKCPGGKLYSDSGGASRFFYCPVAPPRERLEVNGVFHPSVKPVTLMNWLVRLAVPENGVVLDPFAGSGTTGEACLNEGRRAVLIERDYDYIPLIEARLARANGTPR